MDRRAGPAGDQGPGAGQRDRGRRRAARRAAPIDAEGKAEYFVCVRPTRSTPGRPSKGAVRLGGDRRGRAGAAGRDPGELRRRSAGRRAARRPPAADGADEAAARVQARPDRHLHPPGGAFGLAAPGPRSAPPAPSSRSRSGTSSPASRSPAVVDVRVAVVGGLGRPGARSGRRCPGGRDRALGRADWGRLDGAPRLRGRVRHRAQPAPGRAGVRRAVLAAARTAGVERSSTTRSPRRTCPRCRTTSARPRPRTSYAAARAGVDDPAARRLPAEPRPDRPVRMPYRADAPFGFADLAEVAEVAAAVLLETGHEVRRTSWPPGRRRRRPRRRGRRRRGWSARSVGGHRGSRPRPACVTGCARCSPTTRPTASRSGRCRCAPSSVDRVQGLAGRTDLV